MDKLEALLKQSLTPRQNTTLLAENAVAAKRRTLSDAAELTRQQRRQKTLEAIVVQLEALSQSKPVLMIFEDAHWVDPTSLEALSRTAGSTKKSGFR